MGDQEAADEEPRVADRLLGKIDGDTTANPEEPEPESQPEPSPEPAPEPAPAPGPPAAEEEEEAEYKVHPDDVMGRDQFNARFAVDCLDKMTEYRRTGRMPRDLAATSSRCKSDVPQFERMRERRARKTYEKAREEQAQADKAKAAEDGQPEPLSPFERAREKEVRRSRSRQSSSVSPKSTGVVGSPKSANKSSAGAGEPAGDPDDEFAEYERSKRKSHRGQYKDGGSPKSSASASPKAGASASPDAEEGRVADRLLGKIGGDKPAAKPNSFEKARARQKERDHRSQFK